MPSTGTKSAAARVAASFSDARSRVLGLTAAASADYISLLKVL